MALVVTEHSASYANKYPSCAVLSRKPLAAKHRKGSQLEMGDLGKHEVLSTGTSRAISVGRARAIRNLPGATSSRKPGG